jgi:hypothetical protein
MVIMRNECYYYGNSNYSDVQGEVRYAADELVRQAMEHGYIVEGVCHTASLVLVLDFIRRNGWLPKTIWEPWYDEIVADKKKGMKPEQAGKWTNYHIGISPEFRRSHHYWHWLNSVSHTIQVGGTERVAQQEPYLMTDRSGKASMLEYLMKRTRTELAKIPLDDGEVLKMLSDTRYFAEHPLLPDDSGFDLGVWGYPGIGTWQSSLAISRIEKIADFQSLVETTREALSVTSNGRREVTVTEAILESLLGYYYSWYYLHHQNVWIDAYKETYKNPANSDNQDETEFDSNLVIAMKQKRYWEGEELLNLDDDEELYSSIDFVKDFLELSHMDVDAMIRHLPEVWKEGFINVWIYGEVALEGTYWDFWKWENESNLYHNDKVLTAIACYCSDDKVLENKKKLLEAAMKYIARDDYQNVSFHCDKPTVGYAQRRREISWKAAVEDNAWLKELKAYSRTFTRFSIETTSARLFRESTPDERRRYWKEIPTKDWCQAFIL